MNLEDIVVKQSDETPLLYQVPTVDLGKMNKNAIARNGGMQNANN